MYAWNGMIRHHYNKHPRNGFEDTNVFQKEKVNVYILLSLGISHSWPSIRHSLKKSPAQFFRRGRLIEALQ